jgi:plasmid stabilization system protein ParE
MMKEIRLREEAEANIEEAAICYQQQQKVPGYEFLDEVVTLLQSIRQHPLVYSVIQRETRRALLSVDPLES